MNQQAMPSGPSLRHLAGVGVEHVDAVDLHLDLPGLSIAVARGVEDVDVRLAEDDEEVALAGVLEVAGHVQVGVHARLEDRDAPELVELGGVRLVVEGAGDKHVEARVGGLAGGLDEVGARDGAELRPDEDAGALLGARCRWSWRRRQRSAPRRRSSRPAMGRPRRTRCGLPCAPAARRRCSDGRGSWSRSPAAPRMCPASRRHRR